MLIPSQTCRREVDDEVMTAIRLFGSPNERASSLLHEEARAGWCSGRELFQSDFPHQLATHDFAHFHAFHGALTLRFHIADELAIDRIGLLAQTI